MTVTKIYCDICGKEVNSFCDLEDLIFDTKSGMRRRYEVCIDCYSAVRTYIKMRKSRFIGKANVSEPTETKSQSKVCDHDECDYYDNPDEEVCKECTAPKFERRELE